MNKNEVYVVKEIDGEMCLELWEESGHPLMKCGHTANAVMKFPNSEDTGEIDIHCCVICVGLTKDAKIIMDKPNIEGRKSKCSDCGKIADSKWSLPFFEYKPNDEYDRHYDGCWGWD